MFSFNLDLKFLVTFLLLLTAGTLHAQSAANAPASVHIKPASEADITQARSLLQTALTTGHLPQQWLNGGATSVGPMVWKALKPQIESKLKGISTTTSFIDAKPPIQADGIGAITPEHHVIVWDALMKTYPDLKTASIRAATAKEIMYYWGTIPFDIEEPLFAVDTGKDVFIFNLPRLDGKICLFWIDRVAPYEELRTKL